jgi:diadenosine tetraphosphate (Ap4A) HIT family hydrolase
MNCSLCQRAQVIQQGLYPYLVHEFKHSWLLLGEHQFFPGYCVLLSKLHYREMTEMPEPQRSEFFQEMMQSSRIIEATFKPKKMNMCSLGNVVDHVHWHFFPRYSEDPGFQDPPWLRMHLFEAAKITPAEALPLIQQLRSNI